MKFQLSILVSLFTLTLAQDLSQLPTCATTATISSLSSTGCSASDFACICKDQSFLNSLLPLIEKACSSSDVQKTIQVAEALCANAGVTITVPSIPGATITVPSVAGATITVPSISVTGIAPVVTVATGFATGSGSVTASAPSASTTASASGAAGKGAEVVGVLGALSLFGAFMILF
ncbi:MAG: hypothetical protein MMC33_010583 [Icmadophila ericetorum]|nr:hypothetical protein [Icmadophila ericetorum]